MRRMLGVLVLLTACSDKPAMTNTPARDLDVQEHAVAPPPSPSPSPEVEPPSPPAPPVAVAPAAPPPPPPFDPAPTLTLLGWGADTRSMVLKTSQHVYAEQSDKSEPLGKIIAGTRLPIREAVAGTTKSCKVWLAVAPAGWICSRGVSASTKEPLAEVQPPLPPNAILPQQYYDVAEGAQRFKDQAAVEAGTPLPNPKAKSNYMVTRDEDIEINGVTYAKTAVGLIAVDDLRKYRASTFEGIDLVANPPPSWPFAWVVAKGGKGKKAKELAILATPDKKGAEVGTATYRSTVSILEEKDGYVRIGPDQWLPKKSVRIARMRTRPDGTGADGRWIDINRDEQVMIAYAGDKPVFATLVASGRRKSYTPPAIYRLRSKSSVTKMGAEESEASYYMVSEVPWATRFRSGLYFHAAYWHDDFGNPKSHGCVNLSPKDAKWVYDWTTPVMPDGWNELEVMLDGAMIVRVYDEKDPDPPVFDYEKEKIERAKIRKREKRLKEAREAREAAEAAGTATPTTPAP